MPSGECHAPSGVGVGVAWVRSIIKRNQILVAMIGSTLSYLIAWIDEIIAYLGL